MLFVATVNGNPYKNYYDSLEA